MIKRLFEKWFGLEPVKCETCEVLRFQLDESNRERKELLSRALAPVQPEPLSTPVEELEPIKGQFIPWRVRQQMLEAEDRAKAKLMQDKAKEILELEKELGVAQDA